MARSRRGRGEGGVYQRASDGLWVGSASLGYGPDGKRRRVTVYGATKAEAQQKLREIQQQHDRGALPDRGGPTVAEWLIRWLTAVEPTLEPKSFRPYSAHCRLHIAPAAVGRTKLRKLRAADVEAFYLGLLAGGMSPAMARKVGTTLTVALNRAVRAGLIPANPAAGIKKPKASRPDVEILAPDQAAAFAAACEGNRLGTMFLFLLDTGLRPGEAVALTWADVDVPGRAVSVTKAVEELDGYLRVKKPKTKRSVRRVEMAPETVAAVVRWRAAKAAEGFGDEAPLFCDTVGGHLRIGSIHRNWFKPALKAAGLPPVSLYALRHTCATMLLAGGVNPKIVSERLGHSSVTLTLDTYSHVLPTMQAAAAGVIGAFLYRKQPDTTK